MLKRLLPLFAGLLLYADITPAYLHRQPRSLAKDFYISRMLDHNISAAEARAFIGEVKNMNWRLFDKFAKRVDDFSFARISYCRHLSPLAYIGKDDDCIKVGLTPYKATKLPPEKLRAIADRIAPKYPEDAQRYRLIAARDFNTTCRSGADRFLALFNTVGSRYRETVLNHPLPPALLEALSHRSAFNTAIEKIVRNPKLTRLQQSILKFDSSALSDQSNFLLGLNALRLGRKEIAIWYFRLSEKKAYFDFQKDKARFWQYLTLRDKKILADMLQKSSALNFYTLYAHEKLGIAPENIVTEVKPTAAKAPFDITDPFAWIRIKQQFKKRRFADYAEKKAAALRLSSRDTQPHVVRLLYRHKSHRHYYLFPYTEHIASLPPKRQALLLALARQESRFIPTEVSYSYALGMMQFMPFLAKAIAKQEGMEDFRLEQMFDPAIAYRFADLHLDFLQKHLFHPLLIAYAYNGGVGYTRRRIARNPDCFTDGPYEPFMTIEMLPNAQARRYGKRVLTNYVIYAKLLGIRDVTLLSQLEMLRHKRRICDF